MKNEYPINPIVTEVLMKSYKSFLVFIFLVKGVLQKLEIHLYLFTPYLLNNHLLETSSV